MQNRSNEADAKYYQNFTGGAFTGNAILGRMKSMAIFTINGRNLDSNTPF
jgi:hypothetical protein